MIVLSWNLRGIGNANTLNTLKNICFSHKPDLIYLFEPMVSFDQTSSQFWHSIGMKFLASNVKPGHLPSIWILHSNQINPPTIVSSTSQQISLTLSTPKGSVLLSAVYASNNYVVRRQLWLDLTDTFANHPLPWSIVGDFNCILGAHEKRGGCSPRARSCEDFQAWTDTCSLVHLNTVGPLFTWFKKGYPDMDSRLDRSICNQQWFNFWDSVACIALHRKDSDHTPLIFKSSHISITGPKPFKFISAWLTHPSFLETVSNSWQNSVHATCPMTVMQLKLKRLKVVLKDWNANVFGNIHSQVEKAIEQLLAIQNDIDTLGHSIPRDKAEENAQLNLQVALSRQEKFWKEKARIKWIKEGDRNSAFFQKIARQRVVTNRITFLHSNDSLLTDPVDIQNHVIGFYEKLYSTDNTITNSNLVETLIPSIVSVDDNAMLSAIPTNEEIKKAVFGLDPSSAPGPDGFNGSFFQSCWHIIQEDFCKAISQFFAQSWILPGLNSNFLTLLPKIPNADSLSNFRPIALANFFFKVIPKILSERLALIAPKLITPHQNGFIRGRSINHCIGITSECFNLLDLKNQGGNVAIKIDIAKAFDTLDWGFLLKVLHSFGFNHTFIGWIHTILKSAKMSVVINGTPCGYFTCKRGVRQGDPLSPILFCLVEEVLSRSLIDAAESGSLHLMAGPRGVSMPTHSLYADDIMLFCRGDKRNLKQVLYILHSYGQASGQIMNCAKSKVYIGQGAKHRKAAITSVLGMTEGSTPFTYLGVPIFKGKPRCNHLQSIADKVRSKLEGWFGKILSFSGRCVLLKSVICPMLLHSFMTYRWPMFLLFQLQKWMRNFLWTGDILKQKLVTVAWSTVCKPNSAGGLGLFDLSSMNKAAILRQMWSVLKQNSLWSSFVTERFHIKHLTASRIYKISSIWWGYKTALAHIKDNGNWIIGDGLSTNIWHNLWMDLSPIQCPAALLHHNSSVSSLICQGSWVFPPWFKHQFPLHCIQISKITLPSNSQNDTLIWPHSSNGDLSFKQAYCFYANHSKVEWADHLWHSFIPPRISFTVWKILLNKVSTHDNLRKRGCTFVSRCDLCKVETENVDHLFTNCHFASLLWKWIWDTFHIQTPLPTTVNALWNLVRKVNLSSQLKILFIACCLVNLFAIWEVRNKWIFHNIRPVPSRTLHYIKGWLQDLAPLMPGHMNNSQLDLLILKTLNINGVHRKNPQIIEVIWTPPHFHWIKCNTDGMALGCPGNAAIGGVFRTFRGFSKGCFCLNIGIQTAFVAELLAFMQAIELAWEKNWFHIWFELDSKAVVDCVNNTAYSPPWQLLNRWRNCRDMMNNMQLYITHTFREGNAVADKLSKQGIKYPSLQWWSSYPSWLSSLLSHDYASLPNYRFTN